MTKFVNLATRSKLMVGFGIVIVLFAATLAEAWRTIGAAHSAHERLLTREFATAVDVKEIRANQNGIHADLLAMVVTPDHAEFAVYVDDIKVREQDIDSRMQRLRAHYRDDRAMLPVLEELARIRAQVKEMRNGEILPLLRAGRSDEAKAVILRSYADRLTRMRALADDLVSGAEAQAQAAVAATGVRSRRAAGLFLAIALVAVALAAIMVVVLDRTLASPLRRLAEMAGRIAHGDLTIVMPEDPRDDEVGRLEAAFRGMLASIRDMTAQVLDATSVLATAANEIVATTQQVAAAAAETATAVSETSATVEEVKRTAELSSDKARYVSETAQHAATVSLTGRAAVDRSVESVNAMRAQVEVVAESIVRLSEQSQAIAEIITTVNDLAEQSNLLAVNAAIEAAKAGEQGRGFGIVAQEIRSLAEQSKHATGQVRTILADIQKATSSAVLAAEQGSKGVEAGVAQSLEAGATIATLAGNIADAAQAATQIEASSGQQQVGMDQVALAMKNISQASLQNVSGTKQAESAAHDLSALGQRLRDIVAHYRL